MTELTRADIVVVGAGMVGTSFVSALLQDCQTPVRIILVEPARVVMDEAPYQPGFDTRSTALSAGTVGWLRHFGLWQQMQQQATAIKHIHISDQGRFGTVGLDSAEMNINALGYVVENPWMGRLLNQHLSSLKNFTLKDECKVLSVTPTSEGTEVVTEGKHGEQEKLQSSLVVIAEGGRSGLADSLGIHRNRKPYEQQAIIANVVTESAHQNRAWERFTEKGPLALLPLAKQEGQNRSALIWTHPADSAESVMQLPDAEFLQLLQKDFGFRPGRFLKVGKRQMFPLSLVTTEEQIRPGMVLLGNSAHTLHPVAGQGFNLAFRDALVLAEVVRNAISDGKNPGSISVLQTYLEQINQDQKLTIEFSDSLTKLFSSARQFSRLSRKAGLLGVEMLPGLKTLLARQAMGMNGRKPGLEHIGIQGIPD